MKPDVGRLRRSSKWSLSLEDGLSLTLSSLFEEECSGSDRPLSSLLSRTELSLTSFVGSASAVAET